MRPDLYNCPSLCPIRPLQQLAAGLLLRARRQEIDRLIEVVAGRRGSTARNSKCEQCRVYSQRTRLSTDLLSDRFSVFFLMLCHFCDCIAPTFLSTVTGAL